MTKFCKHCKEEIDEKRGGKTAKHFVKYCSDVCRTRSHRRRRGQKEAFSFRVEELVKDLLGIEVDRKSKIDATYDGTRIDIKGARRNERKNSPNTGQWFFSRSSKEQRPDYFLCICFDENENIVKTLLVPDEKFPETGITMGNKSKYDEFEVRIT